MSVWDVLGWICLGVFTLSASAVFIGIAANLWLDWYNNLLNYRRWRQ